MTKGVNERINESVLRWLGHIEIMRIDRVAKRVYVGGWRGSRLVGGLIPWRKEVWMLGKRGGWCVIVTNGGVCEGEWLGHSPENELLTLTRCYNCWQSQLYDATGVGDLSVAKMQFKSLKGKISFLFFYFVFLLLFCYPSFLVMLRAGLTVVGCGD